MYEKSFTVNRCAEILHRHPISIYRMVARGQIPYRKVGGRLLFLEDEIQEFIRNSPGITADQVLKSK